MFRGERTLLVCLGVAAMAIGCKGSGVGGTVEVTGLVTLDGQPVGEAQVSFAPKDASGKPAYASTDSNGRFSLTTPQGGEGALPGDYKVSIVKNNVEDPITDPQELQKCLDAHGGIGPTPKVTYIVPARYNSADKSGLTATVKQGEKNDFTFDLKK